MIPAGLLVTVPLPVRLTVKAEVAWSVTVKLRVTSVPAVPPQLAAPYALPVTVCEPTVGVQTMYPLPSPLSE